MSRTSSGLGGHIHVLLLATLSLSGCYNSDASLRKKLIGTWSTTTSLGLREVHTFSEDGTWQSYSSFPNPIANAAMEYLAAKSGRPAQSDDTMGGRWSVRDGVLNTEITFVPDRLTGGFLLGNVETFRITSIDGKALKMLRTTNNLNQPWTYTRVH